MHNYFSNIRYRSLILYFNARFEEINNKFFFDFLIEKKIICFKNAKKL